MLELLEFAVSGFWAFILFCMVFGCVVFMVTMLIQGVFVAWGSSIAKGLTKNVSEKGRDKGPKKEGVYQFGHIEFTCPECGHVNKRANWNTPGLNDTRTLYCDIESGGCDKEIAVRTKVSLSTKITAHKIEGLNN